MKLNMQLAQPRKLYENISINMILQLHATMEDCELTLRGPRDKISSKEHYIA